MFWMRRWARSNKWRSRLFDCKPFNVTTLVSESKLTCRGQKYRVNHLNRSKVNVMSLYLFGCLDGDEVIVNLLRLGSHLLGLDALVIFASQPELEILVAEFPFEECSIQSGSICRLHRNGTMDRVRTLQQSSYSNGNHVWMEQPVVLINISQQTHFLLRNFNLSNI